MQSAVLGGATCWYRWRSTFSLHETRIILASCLSEPDCGGEFFPQTLHYATLTCYQSLPGLVDTSEFCASVGTEKYKKRRNFTDVGYFRKVEKRRREIVDLRENINIMSQIHLRFPYALQIQFVWWSAHLLSLFTLPDSPLDPPPTWKLLLLDFKAVILKQSSLA